MAILPISDQYKYSKRGPFDAKALVKTYADLLSLNTWTINGTVAAYNGMVTAVWLDKEDTSKNGIYFLHDPAVTGALKFPDVSNEANWHKLASIENLSGLVDQIASIQTDLETFQSESRNWITTVVEKVDRIETNTYTKTAADAKFADLSIIEATYATKDELRATSDKSTSNTLAITELSNRVAAIVESGAEPNIINIIKINGAVQAVNEEDKSVDISVPVIADTKISDLKDGKDYIEAINNNTLSIKANTATIATINEAIANINTVVETFVVPKESDEISVSDSGVLGIRKLSISKLIQNPNESLTLDGCGIL